MTLKLPVPLAHLALAGAMGLSACGGLPPGADPDAATPVLALAPGPYALAVIAEVTLGSPGTGACLVVGSGGAGSAVVDVDVVTADGGWLGATVDGSLTFTLRQRGASVTGTLAGTFLTPDGVTVSIRADNGGPAALVGQPFDTMHAGGPIDGQVVFGGGGGTSSCGRNTWAIAPR